MPRDPLQTVQWLRQRGVDEVRRALSESLSAAAEADTNARAAEREIETEAQRASDLQGDDALVEAFAAWLPGARLRAAQARLLHERFEAEVACRRAELAACRTALEAIQALIEQRDQAALTQQARRAQLAMDEIASRAKPEGANTP